MLDRVDRGVDGGVRRNAVQVNDLVHAETQPLENRGVELRQRPPAVPFDACVEALPAAQDAVNQLRSQAAVAVVDRRIRMGFGWLMTFGMTMFAWVMGRVSGRVSALAIHPSDEDISLAKAALAEARRIVDENACDLLILDEVNVAVSLGLVGANAVLKLMDEKPHDMELILTGRGAPPSFIKKADLVTTMECTKHYFSQGQAARKGIEL